jgi:Na+/H+ antiporter NhaD/arsenite permease-like protein
MLIVHVILAAIAIAALALRPRSGAATLVALAAAAVDVVLGAPIGSAVAVVAPLTAFLGAALTLATLVERSGIADRVASALAARAGGSALVLYALVCATCAALTAAVSLDGAVVLVVPLLLVLSRRFGAPFAPLFLGAVIVANAGSIAVPQGNPTNLVVIDRLHLSPAAFTLHMLVPGLAAAALGAAGVALAERNALTARIAVPDRARTSLTRDERHATASLAAAALAAWAAPLLGVAPWWPFTAAVALAMLVGPERPWSAARRGRSERPRVIVPWRIAGQVAALVVAVGALGLAPPAPAQLALPGLLLVATAVAAASALANNLPVSVSAASLLASGPPAYAAVVGLAVGSMATPHGSVATLIATDIAGDEAPPLETRRLAALAAAGVVAATAVLAATS